MSLHKNPSLRSPFHEGAANILAGRCGNLPNILSDLAALNPDLEIPPSPTLNELASILRRNEQRRASTRKVGDRHVTQLLPPTNLTIQNFGTFIQLNWTDPLLVPDTIHLFVDRPVSSDQDFDISPEIQLAYVSDISSGTFSGYLYTKAPNAHYLDSEHVPFTTP